MTPCKASLSEIPVQRKEVIKNLSADIDVCRVKRSHVVLVFPFPMRSCKEIFCYKT